MMKKFYSILFITMGLIAPISFIFAATGTIDSTNKYAWSNNIGWINFGTSGGSVQVTDTAITGYAWSQNYGWINFNRVVNTTSGVLSGYAWGENTGWINFSGVTINTSTGAFSGTATGDVVGTVNFSCTAAGCPVTTTWRPDSGPPAGGPICGDASCSGTEDCTSCPADCGACPTVVCTANEDCGSDNYTGSLFCQEGNVYQNYLTYVCSSPGETSSSCSDSTEARLKTTCSDSQECSGGSCVGKSIACAADADCGTDDYTDSPVCQDGNVYQNFASYSCDNAGLASSSCSNSTEAKLKITCPDGQVCDGGSCVAQPIHTYNKCENLQCVSVSGNESNQCSNNSDCGEGGGSTPVIESHNECNPQKQCVSVNGAGSNKCQSASDCATTIPEPIEIVESIGQTIQKSFEQPVESVKTIAKETKKIIETPQGSVVTKTISTAGAAVTTAAVASTIIFSPFEIFLVLFRLFGILFTAFGIRKKIKHWGVVYDSVTKQPLDPAYVTLKDAQGKIVASAITDLDGRYGFLVGPGNYQISASKTNYAFPSQKLVGKINDELYNDLYYGGAVEVKQDGEAIIKNIPMDPLKFDWNEFAKKDKKLMRFYSRFDVILRKAIDLFFVVGFFVAIISFFAAPYPYNSIILIIYIGLLVLRAINIKIKAYGNIIEGATKNPLSFAVLRIMMPETNIEVAHKVADKYGRYYCLVPSGRYYVKIEKKNDDESYSLVYTSAVIDVSKKGIIKNKFVI